MVYPLVILGTAVCIGIFVLLKEVLRSRNVHRIVHTVKGNITKAKEKNIRFGKDPEDEFFMNTSKKSPRIAAIELQKVRTLLRSTEKELVKKDWNEAEKNLIQILTIHPDTPEAHSMLARLYLETGRERKAEAVYRNLLQSLQNPSLYANLGLSCYRQKNYIQACQAYQAALNMEPDNPDRSADLARACMAAGRYSEAAPLLKKACERLTRNIDLLKLLAECHMHLEDLNGAEEVYRRINRLDPRDVGVKERLKEMQEVGR